MHIISKQNAPLENLKTIKNELKKRNWAVDAFLFKYKKQEYIVLVKLYSDGEKKECKFAIVKLEFIKKGENNESFCTYATLYKIHIPDIREFRRFFGIEYSKNIGDIIKQFTQHFSSYIPDQLIVNKDKSLKNSLIEYLDKSEKQSSSGIYCFSVKRNGNRKDGSPAQRSPQNNQKGAMLRPDLYKKLGEDFTLSFCFSDNPAKHKTCDEILQQMADKKIKL